MERDSDFALAMSEATEVLIAAIESYRLDATPLLEAVNKPYNFPFMLQDEGYVVTAETDLGTIWNYLITFTGN